jgi:hypothetical protein
MRSTKLQLKLFIEQNGRAFELEPFVPIFHEWIRRDALGELLIDVADYAHVHDGPGIALIGHGSDYFIDMAEGRPGLLYTRKRAAPEHPAERLRDAFQRALKACRLLEQEAALSGHVRFRTDEILFKVVDRLHVANDEAGFAALRDELTPLLEKLYGNGNVKLERVGSPKQLLGARVVAANAPNLQTLLDRATAV